MDIKPIIVRNYLESLTESNELDVIFPLLLESKGYVILSDPKLTKGLPQYGKDVVAVGKDFTTGKITRFYFELKGGKDRHLTSANFIKKDGVKESIIEAKYKKFDTSYKGFNRLPLKIILVHNGDLKENFREVFEGFIRDEFDDTKLSFERWGISELVKYFSEYLFGAYLLTDQKTTRLFNRVLVNLNTNDGVSDDFRGLVNSLIDKNAWKSYKNKLPRKWVQLFESLKLISFILYSESKEYKNLDIAKRYLEFLLLRIWNWILKNKLENDKNILNYFGQLFGFFRSVLTEYFIQTLDIAEINDGLFSEKSGRYEEIGYTYRTFEYLKYLCFLIHFDLPISNTEDKDKLLKILISIIQNNNVSARPLIDIHSNVIVDILLLLIENNEKERAKRYLKEVLGYVRYGKVTYNRLPDANNSMKSVIKFIVSNRKPIYYSDSTSPLMTVLLEFVAILDLEDEFNKMKKLVEEFKIDLGLFVPHHGVNSKSKELIEDKDNDLEEQLFSKSVNDGYQSELRLSKIDIANYDLNSKLNFKEFKEKVKLRKNEFKYNYRTDKIGLKHLKNLAHSYFKTPYFPDKWRYLL